MMMWVVLAMLPLAFAAPWHAGSDMEYFDILDLGKKEWRLAFRGTANIRSSVYDAYKTGAGIPSAVQDGCKSMDWSAACDSHYRNDDALDNWSNVRDVMFGIVHEGALVKTILFNGTNTTNLDWFAQDKIEKSCFPDIKRTEKNFFSIEGHERDGDNPVRRRFFINEKYGGCDNDYGYFVAIDGENRPCTWETTEVYPVFKYLSGLTVENWKKTPIMKQADAIVVFIRYINKPGPIEEYHDVLNTGLKEYRLAFRGTSNVGTPLYPAYLTGAGIPSTVADACKQLDFTATCSSHYRNNDALDKWEDIQEVLVGIVHNGAMVKYLTFSGLETNKTNWFSNDKLLESCWDDLKMVTQNYFSMKGHERDIAPPVRRRFFINKNYGGCDNDDGWMVVVDNANQTTACEWERTVRFVPRIMYSAKPRANIWLTESPRDADAMVIFLKYKN